MTAPLGRPIRGMVQAPTERSRDFKGSADPAWSSG